MKHLLIDTAGIDDEIRFAADFAMSVMAVAGQAGQVVHKRVFGARQAVEQGRFADVRTADKGDGGFHDEIFSVSSVGSEANLQHKQVFSKHGRLKKIRGRLKNRFNNNGLSWNFRPIQPSSTWGTCLRLSTTNMVWRVSSGHS